MKTALYSTPTESGRDRGTATSRPGTLCRANTRSAVLKDIDPNKDGPTFLTGRAAPKHATQDQ